MSLTRRWLLPSIFVFTLAAPAAASPITVTPDDINRSFSFSVVGETFGDDITAAFQFTLTGWETVADDDAGGAGDTLLTFSILVENTSTIPSVLTAFGFNTDPNAERGTSDSTLFDNVVTSGGQFDVCAENDANDNCFGNQGNVGLAAGESELLTLSLYFESELLDSVILGEILGRDPDGFFARFQSVGATGSGSDKAFGQPEGFDEDQPVVPEPTTMLLLGTGLAMSSRRLLRNQRRPS